VVTWDKERETTSTNQAHAAAFKASATNGEEDAEAISANGKADATNEDNKTLSATTTTRAVATNKRHLAMQIQSSTLHANLLIAVLLSANTHPRTLTHTHTHKHTHAQNSSSKSTSAVCARFSFPFFPSEMQLLFPSLFFPLSLFTSAPIKHFLTPTLRC